MVQKLETTIFQQNKNQLFFGTMKLQNLEFETLY